MADYRRVQFVYFVLQTLTIFSVISGQGQNNQLRNANPDALNGQPGNVDNARLLPKQPQDHFQPQKAIQPNHDMGAEPRGFHDSLNAGMNQIDQARNGLRDAARLARPVSPGGASVRLSEHPACQEDVRYFCSDTRKNNFQIIDCLQSTWDLNVRLNMFSPIFCIAFFLLLSQ